MRKITLIIFLAVVLPVLHTTAAHAFDLGGALRGIGEAASKQAERESELERQKELIRYQYQLEMEQEKRRAEQTRIRQEDERKRQEAARIEAEKRQREKEANALSIGSGFFVTNDGYFITNYHVVKDSGSITLLTTDGKNHEGKIVKADRINDLAIIKVDGKFPALPIISSRTAKRGQSVATVGYPHANVQGIEPKVTEGIISSLSGIADDPRIFQISVPIQSGNSGGPLVTREGNVIGIVVSKLSTLAMLKQTGDVTQNVNYAIKSNYLLELLGSEQLDGKLPYPSKNTRNLENVTNFVEKATALVVASPQKPSIAANKTSPSDDNKGAIPTRPVIQKESAGDKTANSRHFSIDTIIEKIAKGDFKMDYGMNVVTPDSAENGAIVPFFINLNTPISASDRLIVVVNDKYPAYFVTPLRSATISHISGRIKMPSGPGVVRAIVVDSKGEIKTSTKNLTVTVGVQSFENGEVASHSNPPFKHKSFYSNGIIEIKILINYPSSSTSFIDSVTTEFSDGAVAISLTPIASKDQFLSFKTNRPENPNYRITVRDNRGGTSTAEGLAY